MGTSMGSLVLEVVGAGMNCNRLRASYGGWLALISCSSRADLCLSANPSTTFHQLNKVFSQCRF
jgi:hypothetical protein